MLCCRGGGRGCREEEVATWKVGKVGVCTSSSGLVSGKDAVSHKGVRSYPSGLEKAVVASNNLMGLLTTATTLA